MSTEDIRDMPQVEPTGGSVTGNGYNKAITPARVNALLDYPDLIAEVEAKIAALNEQEAGRKRRGGAGLPAQRDRDRQPR